MTDLVLVRHGETVWHAENRYAGVSDVALTPRGAIEQAGQLAAWADTPGSPRCVVVTAEPGAAHRGRLREGHRPVDRSTSGCASSTSARARG